MACISCGADLLASGCSNLSCPTRSLTPPAFEAVEPDAQVRRIHELEEALRKYGFHFLDCAVWGANGEAASTMEEAVAKVYVRACTCGLDAALRGG